jgi:threonine synthase
MDVGAPSNFVRMLDLFGNDWTQMKQQISGACSTDNDTAAMMRYTLEHRNYLLDPHGAVAYGALEDYLAHGQDAVGVFLETAHPAKFLEDVEQILGKKLEVPARLAELSDKTKQADMLNIDFDGFKTWLWDNL